MIRVVLTDLDGVVRRWPATQFSSVEDAHGLPRGSMARAAFHETLLTDAITGVVTDAEWRRRIAARLGTQFDPAASAAAVAEWSMSAGEVHTGTLAVLQSARSAAPLGLVSNATTRLSDDLSRLRIADAFDFIVNSSAIGCHKPSACFYEHALSRCGCTPEQVFFVDDRRENVAGAAAFGFQAHLFRDANTLEQALRDAGVLPEGSQRSG
jgi:putative hydrolase of the HAD superfamily